ncbi:hypothetical protein EKG38_15145 [Shewanella canadensis]|uniref:Flagellar FliJ protein n=1 Tax=Shewanella canadensis TaxID=271096 RepID=A0A3S0J5E6_9GAMM|nr:hypothetical protein [Shewanella canadensis]RTR38292.1 hypothetical protein EKG38_15145 [Shewanella canadensis]
MKQLQRLCQQEERKLSQLGRQRGEAQQRIESIAQQQRSLGEMLDEYQQYSPKVACSLLLQNSNNLQLALRPMQARLTRQQILLQQEHLRVDGLWRQQLGRQQGIKWLYQKRKQDKIELNNRQEQKQLDDLASRARTNRS